MTKPVGFDQKLLLHQLDYTAIQSKQYQRSEMYDVLDGYMRNDIKGAKSRKNAITMLMKIWYLLDDELLPIRDEILKEFHQFTEEERLFVHWGLTCVAYPFFRDIANEFGRHFQLQEEVSSKTILKRIKDLYGDKRRVEVGTSAVLTTMKSWGVIVPTEKTFYKENDKIQITNCLLQTFLIKVLLKSLGNKALYIDLVENHPIFFPFQYNLNLFELRKREEFSFYYEGLNNLVVEKAE